MQKENENRSGAPLPPSVGFNNPHQSDHPCRQELGVGRVVWIHEPQVDVARLGQRHDTTLGVDDVRVRVGVGVGIGVPPRVAVRGEALLVLKG